MTNRLISGIRMPIHPAVTDSFDRANAAIGSTETGEVWNGTNWTVNTNVAKSNPTLGSNLVLNSSFDSDTTNWTAVNATLASVAGGISGNCLQVTNVGANKGYAYQQITTEIGKWYRVEIGYKNGTTTAEFGVGLSAGDYTYFYKPASSASWTGRAVFFRATTTTTFVSIGTQAATDGLTIFYDSIQFKEVTLAEMMCTIDTTFSSLTMSVGVTGAQWSPNGLVLNVDSRSNPQNFVIAEITGGSNTPSVSLIKCVNGVYTSVFSQNVTHVAGAPIRVRKIDIQYQLYYNNKPIGATQTISDTEIIRNTIHGMWLPDNQASLNNFSIEGGIRSSVVDM